MKKKKKIKMWIARDEGLYDDDYEIMEKGKLHLFYDPPLVHEDLDTRTLKFDGARCIGEVPSYMYPFIEEGECYELGETLVHYKNFFKREMGS